MVEQPVDIGPTGLGDIGHLATEARDAAAQMVDVPVQRGEIGAVVTVAPSAVDEP